MTPKSLPSKSPAERARRSRTSIRELGREPREYCLTPEQHETVADFCQNNFGHGPTRRELKSFLIKRGAKSVPKTAEKKARISPSDEPRSEARVRVTPEKGTTVIVSETLQTKTDSSSRPPSRTAKGDQVDFLNDYEFAPRQ